MKKINTQEKAFLYTSLIKRSTSCWTANLLTILCHKFVKDFKSWKASQDVTVDICLKWRLRIGLTYWPSSKALVLKNLSSIFWPYFVISFGKNILLILQKLKAPFFVLSFPHYTLINFLIILRVILISVILMLWCSSYLYGTQLELRLCIDSPPAHIGDMLRWESLTIVPAGNIA